MYIYVTMVPVLPTKFTCVARPPSVPQLCECPLLSLYKFCNSKACVMLMAEDASMKVTSTLGAAHKPLSKAHGTRFFVIPFAFPAHSTSAAAQSAPAHSSA